MRFSRKKMILFEEVKMVLSPWEIINKRKKNFSQKSSFRLNRTTMANPVHVVNQDLSFRYPFTPHSLIFWKPIPKNQEKRNSTDQDWQHSFEPEKKSANLKSHFRDMIQSLFIVFPNKEKWTICYVEKVIVIAMC